MAQLFEDQLWESIAARVWLKRLVLVIAALGTFGSAYEILSPIALKAWGVAVRLSGASPSDTFANKYGCIFQSARNLEAFRGQAAGPLQESTSNSPSINISLHKLVACEIRFQFSPQMSSLPTRADTSAAYTQQVRAGFDAALENWRRFEFYLAATDKRAALLQQLGYAVVDLEKDLSELRRTNPAEFSTALSAEFKDDLLRRIDVLRDLQNATQAEFPYRLPTINIRVDKTDSLLQSLEQAETAYQKWLKIDV